MDQLKGSDCALANEGDTLGLRYSLRLLYRGFVDQRLNLITTNELDLKDNNELALHDSMAELYLLLALRELITALEKCPNSNDFRSIQFGCITY